MNSLDPQKFISQKNKLFTFIWIFLILEISALLILSYYKFVPESISNTEKTSNDFNTILLYLSYLTAIIVIPATYKIYSVRKKNTFKKENLEEKANSYLITVLINFSLFEFSAIMLTVATYINKTYEPVYMTGIILMALLLNKPSFKNFIEKETKQN